MKDKLRITLKIADRTYGLNIETHQEEGYRKAADEINNLLRLYEENYAVKDRQDALAMCAISFASQLMNATINQNNSNLETQKQIEKIHHLLDQILQQ